MKLGKIAVLLVVLVLFGTYGYSDADCRTNDRYGVSGTSGTVTDCRTGLIWLQNANCSAPSTPLNGVTNSGTGLIWNAAMNWVAGLGTGICGLHDGSSAGDWRLPTKTEWMAMVAYARYTHSPAFTPALTNDAGTAVWSSGAGSSFTNVQSIGYWSSTTDASDTTIAWGIDIFSGSMGAGEKSESHRVWPVRGGTTGAFGNVKIIDY